MKASILRSIWIATAGIFYTGSICAQSITQKILGRTTRKWVDITMHKWVDSMLNLVRVKCKVINPHKVEPDISTPTIIMCNHSSLFDIPISLKVFQNSSIRMLAKKELAKIPVMGPGMRAAEFPFIDRKNKKQAIEDLKEVKKLLNSGIVMWIAPEGTRSKDGKLGKFKKGGFITAIDAKATIIPIGIRGAFNILPAKTFKFNINEVAEIHIGKPIDAAKYTIENKDELIAKTRNEMLSLVGEAENKTETNNN